MGNLILHKKIPFYSQWISRELVGDIISGKIDAVDDPLWNLSGAISAKEYKVWARNICGMACLKMILEYWKIESPPLIHLAKECAEYGGYKIDGDNINGLFYLPLTNYLKERFKLESSSISPLNMDKIVEELFRGNIFIVSVHYLIRKPSLMYSGNRGGHLVLVSGVDISEKCIYINNPSGHNETTQQNFKINFKLFEKYFAGRGILIEKPFFYDSKIEYREQNA